jgi:beta-glucosidase
VIGTHLSHLVVAYAHKELPIIGPQLKTSEGKVGLSFKVYNEPPCAKSRELAEDLHLRDSNMLLLDFERPRIKSPLWYATINGIFIPPATGTYDFGLCVYGTANLYIDEKLLIDNTTHQKQGTAFYGCGTVEEKGSIRLTAGKSYSGRVDFASAPTNTLGGSGIVRFGGGGVRIGCARQIDADEELAAVLAAAKQLTRSSCAQR